jgi:hypothetical protein
MSESRKRRPSRAFLLLSLLAALAFAAGCSTANNSNGDASNVNHLDASGNSVSGWLVLPTGGSHTASATLNYIATGGSGDCGACHGPDLSGGISNVSCYQNPAGCHHGPVSGWVATPPATQEHGVSAKQPAGNAGFASCQICHGVTFAGGGSQVPCFTCHGVNAPHPARPWIGSPYSHTNTDPSNASICRQCHYPGSPNNPANHPATPAAAGTPPGCFNNTLCHGEAAAPHPVGNAWAPPAPAPEPHGIDAKAAPGATTGFAYCQICHGTGTNFAGGSSGVSCSNNPNAGCHGSTVASPHPSSWLPGDTYVHTDTDQGNASVCAYCHLNGANSPIAPPSPPAPAGTAPGCFNSTLCHGATAPHPIGNTWVTTPPAAEPHGNDAKATPAATTGFAYCQTCHGSSTDFAGGSSGVSCYPCHGASAPHPSQWRTGDTYVHTTTAEGNASVCAICHLNGNNSPIAPPSPPAPAGTAPGCFNSTLCHGATFHPAGWAQSSQHGPVAKASPSASGGFSYCQICHGTGTTPTANFGGGSSGVACYPCHGVNAPHPAGATWVTSATPTHQTTDPGNANVCAQCHQSTAGTPGCFNGTLCHGN